MAGIPVYVYFLCRWLVFGSLTILSQLPYNVVILSVAKNLNKLMSPPIRVPHPSRCFIRKGELFERRANAPATSIDRLSRW